MQISKTVRKQKASAILSINFKTRSHVAGDYSMPKRKPPKPAVTQQHTKHINILGYGVDDVGQRFVQLGLRSHEKEKAALLQIDRLDTDFFTGLNRMGGHLITKAAQQELLLRIQRDGPPNSEFTVATKVGWHGAKFVLPDEPIGTKESRVEVYRGGFKEGLAEKYRCSGSLRGWREMARLATGNSRFILALSQAFVGPIGDILQVEQVGIQLFGEPGSGKTAVAIGAGAAWGLHADRNRASNHGFGETWNNTANNFEPVALGHNHTFLILDETRASDKKMSLTKTILDVIMRLEKSSEKGRLTDTMAQRSWWVPLLSTSNLSLDEMGQNDRVDIDDAHRGRLIDVPNPATAHGIFENLHGSPDHAALAKRIVELGLANHGHASRRFLHKLVAWRQRDEADLKSWLEIRRANYLKRAKKIQSPGRDLLRVHQKFATIYAAGRLAQHLGVLPWDWRALMKAILECERDHVSHVAKHRGSPTSRSQGTELEKLRSYIQEKQGSFINLRAGLVADPQHVHAASPATSPSTTENWNTNSPRRLS